MYNHGHFLSFGFLFYLFVSSSLMEGEKFKESFWISLQNKLNFCLDSQFGQLPKLGAYRNPKAVSFVLKSSLTVHVLTK